MGTKIKAPKGYRPLAKGARIPDTYVWWDRSKNSWEQGHGLDSGRKEGFVPRRGTSSYPHAVPITHGAPKPHTWEPRTLEIGPKVTKEVLKALVLESVDEINQLGTENAKLKNQIAALRRKQKEAK